MTENVRTTRDDLVARLRLDSELHRCRRQSECLGQAETTGNDPFLAARFCVVRTSAMAELIKNPVRKLLYLLWGIGVQRFYAERFEALCAQR